VTPLPDFPYYRDQPVAVHAGGWLVLLGSVAVAFTVLTLVPWRTFPLNLVPALLFVAIPLIALRAVTGPHWTALFRTVGLKEIGLMVAFALLTIVSSFGVGFALSRVMEFADNPASEAMRGMTGLQFAGVLSATVPQLIGEELLGILPFLAVLWLCVSRLGMQRRIGIAVALVVSALIFGAAHLPTYDWNWTQSLLVIGTARMMLTLAYIVTRNLWVSAGAHIINDWSGFFLVFELGHVPIGTAG